MIKHLLLLQFKENIDQKQIDSMFIQFTGLKSTIDGINSIEYGTNKNPEKLNKNFTHAVEVTFSCLEARDHYLVHQDHKELQTVLLDLLSDLIVFDIEC
ncbi:Dabb family protein [bacterium]|nr:Dabb family protein [bacterium]